MHPPEPRLPVWPTTTSKEEPLQLDRLPPGPPCELNYRQGARLAKATRLPVLLATNGVVAGVVAGYLGHCSLRTVYVVSLCTFLAGSALTVLAAHRVVGVAVRWLTSAPQVSGDTLRKYRAGWTGLGSMLRAERRALTGGHMLGVADKDPPRLFAGSVYLVSFYALGLFVLGSEFLVWVPSLSPVLFVLAAAAVGSVVAWRVVSARPVRVRRVWFFVRLAVTHPERPVPPWVLVPSPDAAGVRVPLAAAVLLVTTTCGVFVVLPLRGTLLAIDPLAGFVLNLLKLMVLVVALSVPLLGVFALAFALLTGPAIAALEEALDPETGREVSRGLPPVEGYAERLRSSSYELERDCLLLGAHPTQDFPYLLQGKLLPEHLHIIGPPGTGKTSIGLTNLLMQLIARGDGPCVVIDCKGDPGLFNTVRHEATRNGRTFKFYTNLPNRPTYVFNPFDRETFDKLTMPDAVGLLINSLNLSFGDDYGRAWFSTASRVLLKRSYEYAYPNAAPGRRGKKKSAAAGHGIESFADLNTVIQYLMKGKDGEQFQAARHLSFVVERLAEYPQLNLAPDRFTGQCHPALDNAIHMPEVLRNKEVVYFYLSGLVDSANVGEVGRLAIYSLLTACQHHFDETGRAANAYCVIDEAQTVIAQNIANVLAKARSFGLSLTLAHQSMSQLNPPGGVDLRELVTSCTAVKQIFAARDPWMLKHISAMSGEVRYANVTYDATPETIAAGGFDYRQAVPNEKGEARVRVAESVGNRLTPQDILEISADPRRCILAFEQGYGLTQYLGYFPARVDWATTKEEADRRAAMPWPAATDDTVTVVPNWPSASASTVTPTGAPSPPDPAAAGERLRQLKQSLDLDSDE